MNNDVAIRLGFFFGVFAVMAVWELLAQRRTLTTSKTVRWFGNLSIIVLNATAVRLLFPILPVGLALFAHQKGWGLLNNCDLPAAVSIVASVLALDLVIYLQHIMFHAVPALWRLHMVHHADVDFDCTTGLRFHPVEIVLSMIIKLAAVAALGPPAVVVLIFEVLLNATAIFNHGNVRLKIPVDRLLRWIVVTPDMHRVHHSVNPTETNSNFGFNVPWWDRLFGTYRDQPKDGHEAMTIGLDQYQERPRQGLFWLLALPITGRAGGYPLSGGRDSSS